MRVSTALTNLRYTASLSAFLVASAHRLRKGRSYVGRFFPTAAALLLFVLLGLATGCGGGAEVSVPTGIADVDAILSVIETGDAPALIPFLAFRDAPCERYEPGELRIRPVTATFRVLKAKRPASSYRHIGAGGVRGPGGREATRNRYPTGSLE